MTDDPQQDSLDEPQAREPGSTVNVAAVRDVARSISYDRYLASLLAPRACRDDLQALAAFTGELERIPLLVSETTLGEIRLRWWLDWLETHRTSETGNPVADVFGRVIVRRGLDDSLVREMIEARALELYAQPFANWEDWRAFLAATEGNAFKLASRIGGGDAEAAGLYEFALGYGAARQLVRLPLLAGRGRWGLPPDAAGEIEPAQLPLAPVRARADSLRAEAVAMALRWRSEARNRAKSPVGRRTRVAALPAALTEPYLKALQDQDDWLREPTELNPLGRVWRLWAAWLSGRL